MVLEYIQAPFWALEVDRLVNHGTALRRVIAALYIACVDSCNMQHVEQEVYTAQHLQLSLVAAI